MQWLSAPCIVILLAQGCSGAIVCLAEAFSTACFPQTGECHQMHLVQASMLSLGKLLEGVIDVANTLWCTMRQAAHCPSQRLQYQSLP